MSTQSTPIRGPKSRRPESPLARLLGSSATRPCAGGSYPSHPTSSVHLDIDLLCAPNGIAESGIFRKGSARPERCAHATLGTGQSLPAYSRRLVSLQAVDRFVLAHGTCLRSAGCSASDLEPRCLVACACTMCTSCDLIEVTAPNGVRLQPVADARGASCISVDPRAAGRPRATTVVLSSHGHM